MPPKSIDESIIEENEKLDQSNKNIAKTNKEIAKALEKNNKELKKSNSLTSKLKTGFHNILDDAKEVVSVFAGATWGLTLADAAKNAWDLNNSMTALSAQMGKGAAGVAELEGTVTGMMSSIGSSYQDAKQIVTSLAEAKYDGNLSEAAKSVDMYSRATGVALDASVQFVDQMNKQAGMSTETTTALMAGMANVQQKVGISKNGMEALNHSIIDMSSNMAAFGKSSDEIKRAAVKTTALVGAMEKVGVAAEKTLSLVDRLTDPEKLEDNIMLYSQLGISMEDAMSGNVEITDDMLQELGEKVKSMGPIAGSAFAQSMGMHYKDLVKMSNATESMVEEVGEAANVPEEQAMTKLNELMSNAEGMGKKIENFFNKLKGWIMGLGPIILTALTAISIVIARIWKRHRARAEKDASVMTEAMGASAEQGMNKHLNSIWINVKKKARNIKDAVGKSAEGENGKAFSNFYNTGKKSKEEGLQASIEGKTAMREELSSKLSGLEDDSKESNKIKARIIAINQEIEKTKEKIANIHGLNSADYELLNKTKGSAKELVASQQKEADINQKIANIREKIKINEDLKTGKSKGEINAINRENVLLEDQKLKLQHIVDEEKARQKELEKSKKDYETINQKMKETPKPKGAIGNFLGGVKNRVSNSYNTSKNAAIDRRLEEGKSVTGIRGKIGVAGNMFANSKIGGVLGKIGGALGKVAMIAGPIGILVGLASKFLPGFMEQFKPIADTFLPMLKNLLSTLVKALLPPILKVLKVTLQITMPIIQGISWFLSKILGWIPGVGKALGGISDAAKSMHSDEFLGSIDKAAENIGNKDLSISKSIDDAADAEAERAQKEKEEANSGAAVISVAGGRASLSSAASSNTVEGAPEISSDELQQRAKADNNNNKNYTEMQEQTKALNKSNDFLQYVWQELKNIGTTLKQQMYISSMPTDITPAGEGNNENK